MYRNVPAAGVRWCCLVCVLQRFRAIGCACSHAPRARANAHTHTHEQGLNRVTLNQSRSLLKTHTHTHTHTHTYISSNVEPITVWLGTARASNRGCDSGSRREGVMSVIARSAHGRHVAPAVWQAIGIGLDGGVMPKLPTWFCVSRFHFRVSESLEVGFRRVW